MLSGSLTLSTGRTFSLWAFNLGLACCAVESTIAGLLHGPSLPAGLVPFAGEPAAADVLVVSGTVTVKMAPAVVSAYESLRAPRYVLSYGACSNSGGPYWDSPVVVPGVSRLVPVDVYVPGCPPRPEALVGALVELSRRIDAGLGVS